MRDIIKDSVMRQTFDDFWWQRVLFVLIILAIIVFVGELLWRVGAVKGESARKFIHILSGVFIASWSFLLNPHLVQLLCVAMVAVVYISTRRSIFKSIHKVNRSVYGELLYPIGVLLCSIVAHDPWVFFLAVMHMALADGLAAIIGIKWGDRKRIKKGKKTSLGASVFYMTSLAIFATFIKFNHSNDNGIFLIAIGPALLTGVEWFSRKGLDNITIPLSVVAILTLININ
jgi:phytol kinase